MKSAPSGKKTFSGSSKFRQSSMLTFPVCDAIWGDGPTYMDHATAVGHFILTGVLASVIVVNGMDNTQVHQQAVQNLGQDRVTVKTTGELCASSIRLKS